jgi:glycerol uptake facilitator-like aquaporin
MVYCTTHSSGAHMNPAVTVAVYICGGMRGRRLFGLPASVCALLYMLFQVEPTLSLSHALSHPPA